MKRPVRQLQLGVLWLLVGVALSAQAAPPESQAESQSWVAISWHDVVPDAAVAATDSYAITTAELARQFDYLLAEGWQPISLAQVLAAQRGEAPLPAKAVLLSFDDGLASMYSQVFPLLRAYNFPAVAAVVTSWLEQDEDWQFYYEGRLRGRADFLSWQQIRDMQASGLVEIASHSHDLHQGVLANPQGNTQPAAVTRQYLPAQQRYETEAEWQRRVQDDLAQSRDIIQARTGRPPLAMVWPYGEYNQATEALARTLGMPISLGLVPGRNRSGQLQGLHRLLISGQPDLALFAALLPQEPRRRLQRVVHVDLDYVYDPDPAQELRNLDALIERIAALAVNVVYLQAYADPNGDGTADALYFPNRHLPMRRDLFNRVAWQLRTRANVDVYAWMPVLAFDLPDQALARALAVTRPGPQGPEPAWFDYRRLSPFLPQARQLITEIYADLAVRAPLAGILFHDDAYLAADEDQSACRPDASWPAGSPIQDCVLSPAQKTQALVDFTDQLMASVRQYRPQARSARNLYARVVLAPDAEARFAQSLPAFLAAYDTTALMAMPLLEEASQADRWLRELVTAVAAQPHGLQRTLFELQARDWAGARWLPAEKLQRQMQLLLAQGVLHLGYYPDDFIQGQPALGPLTQGISTRTFPFREYQPEPELPSVDGEACSQC